MLVFACDAQHTACHYINLQVPGNRGGGALRYSVPKWLLFLNQCGEWLSLPA
jgi:hypothetical protein